MPELKKATLVKLKADPPTAEDGPPVPVQFNPSSLKLALSNQVEGGETRGRQRRQFTGKSSTELSFELHFDSADEDKGGKPRSVREKTALVEQFVVPGLEGTGGGQRRLTPPRVRFQWGDLKVDGIISALTLDFDLFAADGTPLRAKMQVAIKEQDARYEILQSDQGQGGGAQPGAQGAGAPGRSGGGPGNPSDQTREAQEGEGAADFASRVGLDPAAWRGVAAGLEGTLSLQAGLAIDFSSEVSVGLGVGGGLGLSFGAGASLEASFGLSAEASVGAAVQGRPAPEATAGFALSAAGGVSAALESVARVQSEAAADLTRRAFEAPAPPRASPSASARPAMPEQPRTPLRLSGMPSLRARTAAPPAPPPPRADPRATSFGLGVPLRPRFEPTPGQRSDDPGLPAWQRPPADPRPARGAGPPVACGCRHACRHGRAR